jgi:hypothetical protein
VRVAAGWRLGGGGCKPGRVAKQLQAAV